MWQSLKSFFTAFFAFVKSVFSESDGTGSSTRVFIGLILSFLVGCGVSFCVSVHYKALTMTEFNSYLSTAQTFLVTVVPLMYALNRGGNALDAYVATKTPPAQPVQTNSPTTN